MTDYVTPPEPEGCPSLWNSGYHVVDAYLPEHTATLAARYALLQLQLDPQPDVGGDRPPQVRGAHSVYADPLAESMLDLATPGISALVGRRLLPTYSYYRVYRPGDSLKPHTDRVSCQVSASICLGYNLDDPMVPPWPLGLRTIDAEPLNIEFEQNPGDMLLYLGERCVHWRREMRGGPNAWHAQVFLHWIDAESPMAQDCLYDARPALGMHEALRDPGRVAAIEAWQSRRDEELGPSIRASYLALRGALSDSFTILDDRTNRSSPS